MSGSSGKELKVVTAKIDKHFVLLVFEDDKEDVVRLPHLSKLSEPDQISDVKNRKGRPPRDKKATGILSCPSGTLRFENELFRIKLVPNRASTHGGSCRVNTKNLPSPDFSEDIPEIADTPTNGTWAMYESSNDKGDSFFRYVRHGLICCGILDKDGVQHVSLSYVGLSDGSLTHVDHRSTAVSAVILEISGVSSEFDSRYRIKLIQRESKYKHEVYANRILMENTSYGTFLPLSFVFHYRLTNDGGNQYAIAVRLEDAINLRQACNPTQVRDLGLTELEILRGFQFMLKGRMSVNTRVEPRSDGSRMQWAHGDHHSGNILVWRALDENGFRRFAYIDFANSDLVYSSGGVTQRLFGGDGRQTVSGNLLTPSGATEAQELVAMFVQLLRSGKFEKSVLSFSGLGLGCTLAAAYNVVTTRLNNLAPA